MALSVSLDLEKGALDLVRMIPLLWLPLIDKEDDVVVEAVGEGASTDAMILV